MLRCSGGRVRAVDDTSRSPTWISPAVGSRKSGDQPQRRGLAAARRAEQADQLPVVDPQRDIVDDRQRSKALGQAAQFNGRQSRHSLYCLSRASCSDQIRAIGANSDRDEKSVAQSSREYAPAPFAGEALFIARSI